MADIDISEGFKLNDFFIMGNYHIVSMLDFYCLVTVLMDMDTFRQNSRYIYEIILAINL